MNIYILNKQFQLVKVVDYFSSFIWTDRYDVNGDFELVVPASGTDFTVFKLGNYIQILESEHMMTIEDVQLKTSIDEGDTVVVSGRSIESFLDRRIVWESVTFSAKKSIQFVLTKIISDAFMTPGERFVENFRIEENPELVDSPVVSADTTYGIQISYANVYDVVTELCSSYGLGFKIIFDSETETVIFKLYKGKDRSYGNEENNPYVIFSPEFENILDSNYVEKNGSLKNYTLIGGQGEGADRFLVEVGDTALTGLDRRELFTDASDIAYSSFDEEGNEIFLSDAEYASCLKRRGESNLSEFQSTTAFDGEIEANTGFVYGKDFLIGDIVEIMDKYGNEKRCRVNELIFSYTSSEGYKVYPTFEMMEEN